jgi:hypothetical protein
MRLYVIIIEKRSKKVTNWSSFISVLSAMVEIKEAITATLQNVNN